jgi:hypothetical protein
VAITTSALPILILLACVRGVHTRYGVSLICRYVTSGLVTRRPIDKLSMPSMFPAKTRAAIVTLSHTTMTIETATAQTALTRDILYHEGHQVIRIERTVEELPRSRTHLPVAKKTGVSAYSDIPTGIKGKFPLTGCSHAKC